MEGVGAGAEPPPPRPRAAADATGAAGGLLLPLLPPVARRLLLGDVWPACRGKDVTPTGPPGTAAAALADGPCVDPEAAVTAPVPVPVPVSVPVPAPVPAWSCEKLLIRIAKCEASWATWWKGLLPALRFVPGWLSGASSACNPVGPASVPGPVCECV